ncbi:MAG: MBL fold metallo-hydrolase [Acidimicrobiales bacterium]
MSIRELVVLGTSAAAPTRHRNHNGYALRWDDQLIFLDPGEGFQRQCTLAGIAIARGNAVCLTHFHGDHCLGLPGLVARRDLDQCPDVLKVFFPAEGQQYYERLLTCTANALEVNLDPQPVIACEELRPAGTVGHLTVEVAALDHRIPAQGYRISEPAKRRFIPSALRDAGLEGSIVGRLKAEGTVSGPRGTIRYEDVSRRVPGQRVAFVMDTRVCPGAAALAEDVDLLVCESTFLETERQLAHRYHHMTAAEAGRLAAEAGVGQLVLTHFSARYPHPEAFREEAGRYHDKVWVASDFDRIPFRVEETP